MTSPRTLCLVAAVAVLAAGLAVFQAGFNDYADASVDRITNLLEAVDFKPEANLAMTMLEDHISQARAKMGGW